MYVDRFQGEGMDTQHAESLFSTQVKVDGVRHHLVVLPGGVQIGMRPGRGRVVPWSELVRLADGPPADQFGIVLDGRLAFVCGDEEEANDRAREQRAIGVSATVIRVPVSFVT